MSDVLAYKCEFCNKIIEYNKDPRHIAKHLKSCSICKEPNDGHAHTIPKISLHDHRWNGIIDVGFKFKIECSCGKYFKDKYEFNLHQKEELNKQLKEQNINVEVV